MGFSTHVSASINFASQALRHLGAYDHAKPPTTPDNRRVLFRAQQFVSPYATDEGARALDAVRFGHSRGVDRWAVRAVGEGLQALDDAWWTLRGRRGDLPNVPAGIDHINTAIGYLQRAYDRAGWGEYRVVAA